MNKSVIEMIRDDDPSYDPLAQACESAGISKETAGAAYARVYYDGYYGPLNAADWREQDGRQPDNVPDALAVLRELADHVEDYKVTEYHYCCGSHDTEEICGENFADCEGREYEGETFDSTDIVNAMWPAIREIYGCGIRNLR